MTWLGAAECYVDVFPAAPITRLLWHYVNDRAQECATALFSQMLFILLGTIVAKKISSKLRNTLTDVGKLVKNIFIRKKGNTYSYPSG